MKKVLVAVLFLAGCVGSAPNSSSQHPVQLLTHDGPCQPAPVAGLLVVDPNYGTALRHDGPEPASVVPVAWQAGYSGRYAAGGQEIEVVGPDGDVLATTGKRYLLAGGFGQVRGVDAIKACHAEPG